MIGRSLKGYYSCVAASLFGSKQTWNRPLFSGKSYLSSFEGHTNARFSGYFPSWGRNIRGSFCYLKRLLLGDRYPLICLTGALEKVGPFAQGPKSHLEERDQGPRCFLLRFKVSGHAQMLAVVPQEDALLRKNNQVSKMFLWEMRVWLVTEPRTHTPCLWMWTKDLELWEPTLRVPELKRGDCFSLKDVLSTGKDLGPQEAQQGSVRLCRPKF